MFDDPDNLALALETSFRKPLSRLVLLTDREMLQRALRDHVLVQVKCELDQFRDGLRSASVLESMQQYPSLMSPMFTASERRKVNQHGCIKKFFQG
ncbi:MAG: hypothetical protein A6F71_08240 [Cycloclasticus sp. symbiont of Poecilosclerida sp. M]|nr:MAG: hypothetical protein A6F71_08240 [Cycloclasticus sp. symbiont of Poecilosclerida sp. M]